MPPDPKTLSIANLAKYGCFDELCRRAARGASLDLASVFERAVTDFRTVKRNRGHQHILKWCVDQGLDLGARIGWLEQSVDCVAAAYGSNEIVEYIDQARGLPQDPFVRASVGDLEFLRTYAQQHKLAELRDANGFNLLFPCAQSGLGRRDEATEERLSQLCHMLLEQGVDPQHEVERELPISPAFLCAASSGNPEIMRLLIAAGGLPAARVHLVWEHSLEPHQRSGEPFYQVAEVILQHGFDINEVRQEQGRTLLHAAANRGTVKAVTWLLQHGASPNARDVGGRTPLHVCAERNTSTTVLKLLIDAGAELNAQDAPGQTPLDYALRHSRTKVAEYLRSVGGVTSLPRSLPSQQ